MNIDAEAKNRIAELEQQIIDLIVLNDLQAETISDLQTELRVAKAQIRAAHMAQKVNYGVA